MGKVVGSIEQRGKQENPWPGRRRFGGKRNSTLSAPHISIYGYALDSTDTNILQPSARVRQSVVADSFLLESCKWPPGEAPPTPLHLLVIAKMRPHKAFPEFAMVRHGEVQQLMDDDVIRQLAVQCEQFAIEVQIARG